METFHVNIVQLVNAEGAFKKVGDGTLVIDDLRDEVRVTGFALVEWVKVVLIILCIMLFLFLIAPFIIVVSGPEANTTEHGYTVALLITIAIPLGLILLTIYRKKIFPKREVVVRLSQSDLGLVWQGEDMRKGPVANTVKIVEVQVPSRIQKWVEVLPQCEADGQAIVDGVSKLRDG